MHLYCKNNKKNPENLSTRKIRVNVGLIYYFPDSLILSGNK